MSPKANPIVITVNLPTVAHSNFEPPRRFRRLTDVRTQPAAGLRSLSVVGGLKLDGWDVAAVLVEAAVVEPVDPLGGGDLDVVDGPPGLAGFDQLGLVQAVDRLGQGVVVGAADRADRGRIPASASRSVNRIDVYCDPRSVW